MSKEKITWVCVLLPLGLCSMSSTTFTIPFARTLLSRCVHGVGRGSRLAKPQRGRRRELTTGVGNTIIHGNHNVKLPGNYWGAIDGELQFGSAGHQLTSGLRIRSGRNSFARVYNN